MEKINVFDVQIPDGRQIRCISYNKVTYFDLDDICKLCFDSYDLHDVADTKVMSEFLHREGGRYWVTVDGVRQLYRRIEFDILPRLKAVGFLDTNARNPDIAIAGITLALQFGNALPKYITGCKNITVVDCAARRAYPRAVA